MKSFSSHNGSRFLSAGGDSNKQLAGGQEDLFKVFAQKTTQVIKQQPHKNTSFPPSSVCLDVLQSSLNFLLVLTNSFMHKIMT